MHVLEEGLSLRILKGGDHRVVRGRATEGSQGWAQL
jgi:hypothetical protein